jgi:imidazolonepropionase-like amidohydrolase
VAIIIKIINAKIFTMSGETIENGFVEFNNKIISVGEMKNTGSENAFDAHGDMLFPGFIDAHTHLGICEDSLGFEGDDCNEMTDPCTPHLRAVDAVNALDICFDEAVKAGVTTVLTGPGSANPIAGQIIAMKTYGSCVDNMIIKAPAAIKFALGENPKTVYNEKKAAPSTRMATAAIIREQLTRTKEYIIRRKKDKNCEFDAKLEALSLLFEKNLPAHFHAHRADDIFTAVRIAEEFSLNYSIIHCTQGHLIAQELADRGVSAMSGPLFADRSKPELKNSTPATPGVLCKAGVKTAIVTDHPVIPIQYLALCAGLAVREGMEYFDAVKSITIIPAEICGISDRVGSIETGKDADMVLFDKDPLTLAAKPKLIITNGNIIYP